MGRKEARREGEKISFTIENQKRIQRPWLLLLTGKPERLLLFYSKHCEVMPMAFCFSLSAQKGMFCWGREICPGSSE